MIGGQSVLGLIPARGGSKGVPGKNLRTVGGKPLIAWTVSAAHRAKTLDRVILSTDDAEIAEVARAYDCDVPFMRPAELATDDAAMLDVVRHAIRSLEETYDYVVLLQPTSPLRTAGDIDAAVELCHGDQAATCVSVCEPEKSPFWNYYRCDGATLSPVLPEPLKTVLLPAMIGVSALYLGFVERAGGSVPYFPAVKGVAGVVIGGNAA